MTDNIIDFDGFEKYGPPANVSFSSFSSANANLIVNGNAINFLYQGFFQEWFAVGTAINGQTGLITGLAGSGSALALRNSNFAGISASRSLPANYTRIIFGFAFMASLVAVSTGIQFTDGVANAAQCSIWIDTGGHVNFSRSGVGGANVLFTSSATVTANSRHYLEIDVTIHNTAGHYQIWLDGVSLTNSNNLQNTAASTTNLWINVFSIVIPSGSSAGMAFDDMYWRDNTSGTATPFGDCTISTLAVAADSAVQFTPTASVLGGFYIQQTSNTNAPGIDLVLVPVTPAANMTINSVSVHPQAASSIVKFKGVIYSDSAGSPGSLLSSGTEVIGCFTGIPRTFPLVTPQALTSGTQYWIGYITDTSLALQISNTSQTVGQKKLNTYASGAPAGPLSGMTTGQNPWCIWGNCTGAGTNVQNVNRTQMPIIPGQGMFPLNYNSSTTVGNKDLFSAASLPVPPPNAVYSVKVSTYARRGEAGARTMNIHLKSGTTDSTGSNTAIVPTTSLQWYSSHFDTDPNTGGAWGAGGINNMKVGYEVNS